MTLLKPLFRLRSGASCRFALVVPISLGTVVAPVSPSSPRRTAAYAKGSPDPRFRNATLIPSAAYTYRFRASLGNNTTSLEARYNQQHSRPMAIVGPLVYLNHGTSHFHRPRYCAQHYGPACLLGLWPCDRITYGSQFGPLKLVEAAANYPAVIGRNRWSFY